MKNETIKNICAHCKNKNFCFLQFNNQLAKTCIKKDIEEKLKEKADETEKALACYNHKKKTYNKITDEVKDAKKEYKTKLKYYELFKKSTSWIYED